MSQKLSAFMKNDKIFVESLVCNPQKRALFESFGIFEGATLQIFYKDHSKMILKIGESKLALSKKAAEDIQVSQKI